MVAGISPANIDLIVVPNNYGVCLDAGVLYSTEVLKNPTVSLSWGGAQYPGQKILQELVYDTPNSTILAASGDFSFGPINPSVYPKVVAVGGTRMQLTDAFVGVGFSNKRQKKFPPLTEMPWKSTGGGWSAAGEDELLLNYCAFEGIPSTLCTYKRLCQTYGLDNKDCAKISIPIPLPDYQKRYRDIVYFWRSRLFTETSAESRLVPDVAALADPYTAPCVYYEQGYFQDANNNPVRWASIGGTSAATPVWAAILSIAAQLRNNKPYKDGIHSQLYPLADRSYKLVPGQFSYLDKFIRFRKIERECFELSEITDPLVIFPGVSRDLPGQVGVEWLRLLASSPAARCSRVSYDLKLGSFDLFTFWQGYPTYDLMTGLGVPNVPELASAVVGFK